MASSAIEQRASSFLILFLGTIILNRKASNVTSLSLPDAAEDIWPFCGIEILSPSPFFEFPLVYVLPDVILAGQTMGCTDCDPAHDATKLCSFLMRSVSLIRVESDEPK